MTLSEYIKKYRTDHNLSMQDLADRCGLSKGYISILEGNKNFRNSNKTVAPSVFTLKKLSKGMNIDFDDLLESVDGYVSLRTEKQESVLDRLYRDLNVQDLTEEEIIKLIEYGKFLLSIRKED